MNVKSSALGLAMGGIMVWSAGGCELITAVDRSLIPSGSGGAGGGASISASSSSSSSSSSAASSSSTSSSSTSSSTSSGSTTSSSSSTTSSSSSTTSSSSSTTSSSSGVGGMGGAGGAATSSSSTSSSAGGASTSSSSSGTVASSSSSSSSSASSSSGATDGGSDGGCTAGDKVCNGECVAEDDPEYGCTPTSCTACSLANNVQTAGCSGGACSIVTCDTGFADCNNDPSDGCETNITTALNCGGCGVVCPAADQCHTLGACNPSAKMCAYTPRSNGTSCAGGTEVCSGGTCVADCFIAGTLYASGTVNAANPCQVCTPSTSTNAWSSVTDGTSCAGGTEVCSSGACVADCFIAGTLYPSGTVNPANTCQVCAPSTSTNAWSSVTDGTSCAGGTEVCSSGACVTDCFIAGTLYPSRTVNPANACQVCTPSTSTTTWSNEPDGTEPANCPASEEVCSSGACANVCFIAGTIYTPGTQNPANECQTCVPAVWLDKWTNANDGTSCAGGTEVCSDGTCTADCVIGGQLYPSGTVNTANPCQVCAPSTSTTTWSSVTDGTGCTNGGEVCSSGACVSDCFIGGALVPAGTVNPANACQVCTPTALPFSWSDQPSGTACGSGLMCSSGSCDAIPYVVTTSPADGSTPIAGTTISITFSTAMDPSTLGAQSLAGSCSGSVQVSHDGFNTCIAFASGGAPVMSAGGTVATFTVEPGLLVNEAYSLIVTTGAASTAEIPMATAYTMTGFTTVTPTSPIVQDGSGSALEVNYCNMQYPNPTVSGSAGESVTFYGRIYEVLNGNQLTGHGSASSQITAQFGYAPANGNGSAKSNPEYEAAWTWATATFNQTYGSNDEYLYTLTLPATGSYNFTYRFSVDNGASWTTCDDAGVGSNSGLSAFDFDELGVLTVN